MLIEVTYKGIFMCAEGLQVAVGGGEEAIK